jgi:glyoxylase-like metal-dependent hydrolase (beta-lactamase superfamily II)
VQPTNPDQYERSSADRVPEPDEVRPGIGSIPLPMTQPGNPYSFCYAIEGDDGSVHLIDTGYDTDENWQLLEQGLAGFGHSIGDVASLFVTHLHPDHLGLSGRLQATSGTRIGMLRREHEGVLAFAAHGPLITEARLVAWGVPADRRTELLGAIGPSFVATAVPVVDRGWEPGDVLDIPGRTLRLLATPGHTAGSACIVDDADGLLFTGDTVLPKIFAGLGLGDPTETSPIADYLASLESLAAYDDYEVAPGHQFRFRGLIERNAVLAEHHLHRSRAAAAVIAEQPDATVWEVAGRLRWTAGWENLRGFFLFSALSQTELHVEFARTQPHLLVEERQGRVSRPDPR